MRLKYKTFIKTASMVWMLLLVGCHTVHPTQQTAVQKSQSIIRSSIAIDAAKQRAEMPYQRSLPANVNTALLPPLSHYVNPAKAAEPRFDVVANNMPAKEFFSSLVAGTRYNMVIHPSINGNITLNLKNVTVRQAMAAVRDLYGYEYYQTSYGFEIKPPQLETRIYHINYLDVQRTGKSYTQLTTGEVTSVGTISVGGSTNTNQPTQNPSNTGSGPATGTGTISSIETKSEMQFWKGLEKTIANMIAKDDQHTVTVNAQAGVIAVRAYTSELNHITHFINNLQASLNRQVILEAKILEVTLNDNYQAGIDWAVLGNPAGVDPVTGLVDTTAGIGQNALQSFANTPLDTLNGIFAIRTNGNFKTLIQLLQSQGNVQVLSSPRISTINNQNAVIKVGSDEFFVTGVSTSNTIIGTNTLPSQNVSLTPFFSGVTLDVTPEISSDSSVVLHIHPSVSKVTEQTKSIVLGSSTSGSPNNLILPLAASTIRESDNIVRAKNGQVIVIGGLMQNIMTETVVGTPWLSKVPFIGGLFRRTQQNSMKSELVILLRPIVANNQNMISALEQENQAFKQLHRPFHAGGLPKVFGNEAERADNE
ncbi:MAG TPA: pilus (MSHA type) biogenesis protein MshL [Gammaproteobacteria bacterium]|jgi:MSHA biogenesis protein MshL|nr:pilus (MSHA type) biogenesis protein MshL [Gammaproteobacteria bacterium]